MVSRLFFIAVALAFVFGLWLARPAPPTAADQEQPRLNQPAPVPRGETVVGQTFVAAHNGLSAIELLAVVYPGTPAEAALTLRLLDADDRLVASSSYSGVAHNAPLRLNFRPLPDSAGQAYTLLLEGTAGNNTTVWAYSLDGYPHGTLLVGRTSAPGDLRFSTTYTLLWLDTARESLLAMGWLAGIALPLWLVLFAPGLLILEWIGSESGSGDSIWLRAGLALALSLSVLPLMWLWMTVAGSRWSVFALWAAYLAIGIVLAWRWLINLRSAWPALWARRPTLWDVALAFVLFAGLTVRLLAVRELAFPQWVDSSHHFLITRLLAEAGRVPESYAPLLPVETFTYHFGFHALAATLQWLTNRDLIDIFLLVGQLLNALVPLAVFTFVSELTERPCAGVMAAFFVGLVSLFPGYYVSWGRYTQLTGILILAPLLAEAWRMAKWREAGRAEPTVQDVIVSGVLMAGLLLTHYRVLAFFASFALVALAAGGQGGWKRLGLAWALGAALAAPWLVRLATEAAAPVLDTPRGLVSASGYNAFPVDYFRRELEEGWIALAAAALGWGLARRDRVVWLVGSWIAVTFALLNIGPGTWLVNNNAWAITLFLPGALLLGWGGDQWWERAAHVGRSGARLWRAVLGALMSALPAGLIAYAGTRGLVQQITISNPSTVLITPADKPALEWVAEHTPPDSVLLINGWLWLNGIWAGSDGGAWVWPLTGRRTTLPPVDYTFDPTVTKNVNEFNARVAQVQDWSASEALALLRDAGVTHIFIGAKGGTLKPEMFVNNPSYRLLYSNGAAWVFEVQYGGHSAMGVRER
jgi:hypothetical protein